MGISCSRTRTRLFDRTPRFTIQPLGNFHDEGTAATSVDITVPGAATLTESFTSSLAEPVLIVPTTKAQCKKGGWKTFGVFKNQGDCVSFVATGGKNPPSG